MNFNKLKSSYTAFSKIASVLLKDKKATLNKVQEGLKKATENKGSLSNVWDQLQLLFSLSKDYTNGTYTSIPKSSIIAILAALLYFISPLDIIPDFLVGLGFVDDAFILGLVYKQVIKELDKYQVWKDGQKKIIHI
ncbi:DUF1232 domain-containing protein [Pedobacter polaris]|uniref:DUF1232 domain-containing protein n=1 Tax=Pedobacter polaris TaxID=2571273 RepID=A0A4U1CVB0_9SPHI|nr:YkvA family protein [Pedobacter polaris]TKC12070.1 DUF1232 domain-containing protein [Pedobacter polaris]